MTTQSLSQELNQLIMSGLEERTVNVTSLPAAIIEYDRASRAWRVRVQSLGGSEGDTVPLASNELIVFRETEDVARVLTQLVAPPRALIQRALENIGGDIEGLIEQLDAPQYARVVENLQGALRQLRQLRQ